MGRLAGLGEFLLAARGHSRLPRCRPSRVKHLLVHPDLNKKIGGVMPACSRALRPFSFEKRHNTFPRRVTPQFAKLHVQLERWVLLENAPQMRLSVLLSAGLRQPFRDEQDKVLIPMPILEYPQALLGVAKCGVIPPLRKAEF